VGGAVQCSTSFKSFEVHLNVKKQPEGDFEIWGKEGVKHAAKSGNKKF